MKKALIVYRSRKGQTRKYGEAIGRYLREKGLESVVMDIGELKAGHLQDISHLLLGCWTSGLYFILQHPDRVWVNAVKAAAPPGNVKAGLFTTYKLATGRMFKAMKKHIPVLQGKILPEWKSKNGLLSESDRERLNQFIQD